MNDGVVISIRDLVVKVQFDEDEPGPAEVLLLKNKKASKLLVDSLAPGGIAVCLNIESDRSIQKGMKATRTGKGIQIPVGKITIGRVFDALGNPLDGKPAISGDDVNYKE